MSFLTIIAYCIVLYCKYVISDDIMGTYLSEWTKTEFLDEYDALGQCLDHGTLHEKRFALKFQLMRKCDKGILICYSGTLDPQNTLLTNGMSLQMRYRLDNLDENNVNRSCHEKWEKCRNESGNRNPDRRCGKSPWHGLMVSTMNNDANHSHEEPDQQLTIQTSFSNDRFDIGQGHTEFIIVLADKDNLLSYATYINGQRIRSQKDEAKQAAFLAQFPNGTDLVNDFAGLWLLGLDMLPFHKQTNLKLRVYRDCGCDMHAWLLHPEDMEPAFRPELAKVPALCRVKLHYREMSFRLPEPVRQHKVITFHVRMNPSASDLNFHFDNQTRKELLLVGLSRGAQFTMATSKQEFNISDAMLPTEVQFFKHFANPLLRKILHGNLNKSVQWVPDEFLKFEVHVRKYSYDVYMQDLLLWRHVPRPNDWWMHEQMHELTTLTIGVPSDIYPDSFEGPYVRNSIHEHAQPNKFFEISKRLRHSLYDFKVIVVRGVVLENAKMLTVELLVDGLAFNEYAGAYAISVTFNFERNTSVLKNHQIKIKKSRELPNPLHRNEPFECRITLWQMPESAVDPEQWNFSAESGENNAYINFTLYSPSHPRGILVNKGIIPVSVRGINYVHVQGDVDLIDDPKIIEHRKFNASTNSTNKWEIVNMFAEIITKKNAEQAKRFLELDSPLRHGTKITIQGNLKANASYLNIALVHSPNLFNNLVSEVPFYMFFNVAKRNVSTNFSINTWLSEPKNEMGGKFYYKKSDHYLNTLYSGEFYKIEIFVNWDHYEVRIRGKKVAVYKHHLPTWTANYILVRGDYEQNKITVNKTVSTTPKAPLHTTKDDPFALPFLGILDQRNAFAAGDQMEVAGVVERGKKLEIQITLTYERLESYDLVPPKVYEVAEEKNKFMGFIVLDIRVWKSKVQFLFDCGRGPRNCKNVSKKFSPPLRAGEKFRLTLHVEEAQIFKFKLDDHHVEQTIAVRHFPAWTAQYVWINGTNFKLERVKRTIHKDNGDREE